jgi:malonyl-CoA/methylmalonyl-CoA synthetase
MNLPDLFAQSLISKRDKLGLLYGDRSYTFGQIEDNTNQLARLLNSRGLNKGDRLCVYLENSPEMIQIFIACTKVGVTFVPINILYKTRELTHILEDANPKAVVARVDLPKPHWDVDELFKEISSYSPAPLSVNVSADTTAAFVYTSGTTGLSKGAMLTHNNFGANGENLVFCWHIQENDRLLLPLPLSHVHGLANGVISWLLSGCQMRLLQRFDHHKIVDEFFTFKPTIVFAVPTIYVRLLEIPSDISIKIGSFVRLFVSGSAPLPAQILNDFKEKYGHTILERYGMTEALMCMSNPYEGERRPGSVGKPFPGLSVKIMKEGKEADVEEVGEIYLKGPTVFAGYWNKADATKEAFFDGYFKTGDIGFQHKDGYYTLIGRSSELIISGGFNVYPKEIEDFLLEHDKVQEVAVIGITNTLKGEVPVAYIVSEKGFDQTELEKICRENLAPFKVPKAFIRVDILPRTALGKVQKHLLPKPEINL